MNRYPVRPHASRGAILVLVAILLTALLAILALVIDAGYLYVLQADLQTAADSAALAGASGLGEGSAEARRRAQEYTDKNPALTRTVSLQDGDIQLGTWNPLTRTFVATDGIPGLRPDAVRVVPRLDSQHGNPVSLFFAGLFGHTTADVGATATAVFGSRDVVLVLDYSASMSDDSELLHIAKMGREEIEGNLERIYQDLGSPRYGNMTFVPKRITGKKNSEILTTLGLTHVPYPYPRGSWSEYLNYVQGNIRGRDSAIEEAGYKHYYGYLTLVNYWQEVRPMASETPNLWKTHEQPLAAVKDGVTVFLSYIQEVHTSDQVALASYTSEDGHARLEVPLTSDMNAVEDRSRRMQAGHYHRSTNIAAGLQVGREELVAHARPGTLRMMVLLSDGKANWLRNFEEENERRASQAAIDQAELAAAAKIPIVTISLGADADTDLMQEIADITKGFHFIVPGGKDVSDYEDALIEVFARIAANAPLKLVD